MHPSKSAPSCVCTCTNILYHLCMWACMASGIWASLQEHHYWLVVWTPWTIETHFHFHVLRPACPQEQLGRWQTSDQKYYFVKIIRNLNGSCGSWHVSWVSSHTLADILLSCLGKRFHKFIPQEFLPLVRDGSCVSSSLRTDCCKAAVTAATCFQAKCCFALESTCI